MTTIRRLPEGSHYDHGESDNAQCWYPDDEIRVDGSFGVRSPSRAWPYSYINHYYTLRFARLLALKNPKLY